MYIERLGIRRLRGIEEASISLHRKLTLFIGANNAGKSTILDALAAVLTFRRGVIPFREVDFRMESPGADVRRLPPIEVDIDVAPSAGERFEPTELPSEMTPSQNDQGEDRIYLRLIVGWNNDASVKNIDARLHTLDAGGNTGREWNSFPLRDVLPYRGLGADRDLKRGLGGRWSDWGLILGGVRPDESVLSTANRLFRDGTERLMAGTEQLRGISQALSAAGTAVGLEGAEVELSVVPREAEELLQRMIIEMRLPAATRTFSAERHGMGTQGALLFAIYKLYVDEVLRASGGMVAPVLTVEEPEAHLHPTAQRAMAKQLAGLPGQVIATSHSAELVNGIQGNTIIMRSKNGKSVSFQTPLDEKTRRILRPHPRALFARTIMLIEGMEADLVPMFAAALGIDLDEHGIEVINVGGQNGIPPLWRVLGPRGLGFPIVCIADADHVDKLNAFLSAVAVDAEYKTLSPDRLIAALRLHEYFACAYGQTVEHELVDCAPDVVDRFFEEIGEGSFQQWRQRAARESIGKNKGSIGDLDERAARIARLSRLKSSKSLLAAMLTQNGKDNSRIPSRFTNAFARAIELTKV